MPALVKRYKNEIKYILKSLDLKSDGQYGRFYFEIVPNLKLRSISQDFSSIVFLSFWVDIDVKKNLQVIEDGDKIIVGIDLTKYHSSQVKLDEGSSYQVRIIKNYLNLGDMVDLLSFYGFIRIFTHAGHPRSVSIKKGSFDFLPKDTFSVLFNQLSQEGNFWYTNESDLVEYFSKLYTEVIKTDPYKEIRRHIGTCFNKDIDLVVKDGEFKTLKNRKFLPVLFFNPFADSEKAVNTLRKWSTRDSSTKGRASCSLEDIQYKTIYIPNKIVENRNCN